MASVEADGSDRRESLLTRGFVLAWLANFCHATGVHAYLHWPGWLDERGASEVEIGVLVAVISVAAILSRPTLGRIMDTRGRRIVFVVGGLIQVLASGLYLALDTLPGLPWAAIVGVRVIHGFGVAAVFSVFFTIAADIVPASRRAEGIGLFGVSGLIPMAVGGLLGDVVVRGGDYRPLFIVAGCCSLVGLVCSLPLVETRRGGPSRTFFAAAMARELRSLWFVGTAFAMGFAAYFVFLKTYLIEAPQLGTMGMFFSVYAMSAVILRVAFGWVPERLGLMRVLMPSLYLVAAGLVLLALGSQEWHLIAAAIACGVGHGFAFPILSAIVVTRAQPDERGSAVSLFTALFDLGILLGGPTFGLVAKLAGYPATFAVAAGIAVVAALVFWLWERAG